jgi:hypothetical protein
MKMAVVSSIVGVGQIDLGLLHDLFSVQGGQIVARFASGDTLGGPRDLNPGSRLPPLR